MELSIKLSLYNNLAKKAIPPQIELLVVTRPVVSKHQMHMGKVGSKMIKICMPGLRVNPKRYGTSPHNNPFRCPSSLFIPLAHSIIAGILIKLTLT